MAGQQPSSMEELFKTNELDVLGQLKDWGVMGMWTGNAFTTFPVEPQSMLETLQKLESYGLVKISKPRSNPDLTLAKIKSPDEIKAIRATHLRLTLRGHLTLFLMKNFDRNLYHSIGKWEEVKDTPPPNNRRPDSYYMRNPFG